jgi:hypothetical protein
MKFPCIPGSNNYKKNERKQKIGTPSFVFEVYKLFIHHGSACVARDEGKIQGCQGHAS